MTSSIELPFSFEHLSLPGGVRAAMQRNPGKIALKHHEQQRSYGELMERVDQVCAGIIDNIGLKHGEHAAIVAANSIEYLEIILGASQAGIGTATVNPRLSPPEIVAICDDAEARVLFADQTSAEALKDRAFKTVGKIIVIGPEFEGWLAQTSPLKTLPTVEEWDTFTIPYTSGTTGKPKGVLVPHRSRVISLYAMAVEYGCFAPDDRFLAIAPMCHGAGMIFALAPIFFGGYAEIMDRFEPEQVVRKFRDEKITGFFGVPTHFHAIFSLEQSFLDEHTSKTLHTIISNAAPLPQTMKEKIIGHFGQILHETYGSTEASIVSNLRPGDQLRKTACVGQAFPGTQIEIRREDGSLCKSDEVGELFSTSSCLFNGYWRRPDETAEAFHAGWVTVGDLAKKDSEGHLYIVDRKKDMVISGGINIYPRDIEETLLQHPAISDTAVIGIADEKWGEKLKAFIVLAPGKELDADGVAAFCEGRISSMKTPKEIAFIEALPRNASGKVLKTDLRQR
ncbi:MAG: AMP-binding protein [Gammaproteobacteria bacterium]|nr:AMP-binding protein [Gammaproteobacteria bacterium]MCP4091470.1 AMP-binding protein [Gammaproteobacteria bacterium]MCP4275381.1 AMP-binding protein [Gammaproteobacteria bacterium]MCP4832269.1 AMP-binding protein [Gammaproteobacteria bacterium]MCP4928156.1 AMP-binding protein [Gammaproteobacteria bacterium]